MELLGISSKFYKTIYLSLTVMANVANVTVSDIT